MPLIDQTKDGCTNVDFVSTLELAEDDNFTPERKKAPEEILLMWKTTTPRQNLILTLRKNRLQRIGA
jgi:hypothetical protein